MTLWEISRVAALTAFAVLVASLLTGIGARTALFAPVARNKAMVALHEFLSWFWVPLVVVHVVGIVVDHTARVGVLDTVVPFRVAYASTAIGLGTVGFLLLVLTLVTSLVRHHMSPRLWRWLHRLTYPMLVVFLLHAQLAGSDFSDRAVSIVGWAALGCTLLLAVPRLIGARVGDPS
jgi:sulfoxide reductase heme-binding subunit YedZ